MIFDRRYFLGSVVASAFTTTCAPIKRQAVGKDPFVSADQLSYDAELPWRMISEISPLLKSRSISSFELTEFMLQRVEQLDSNYNSYLTVMRDQALLDARRADREISAQRYLGPLHGVPIAVKDLCNTRGVVTTAGMSILEDNVPDFDATVVTRLRKAGAVILGKLNMTEGAMGGYNRKFKVPQNPWNSERWTGASSSGSGVATAAGLAYATLGSDTGGSIRFPSAACGIVGLKPTWGRVSRYGVFPLAESLDHVGPMARSTADCAYVLEAIAGYDENDVTSLPGVAPRFSRELGRSVEGLVVGWDERYCSDGVHDELTEALREAIETLRQLGATIKPVQLPDLRTSSSEWFTIASADALAAHSEYYPDLATKYGSYFREFLEKGTEVTGIQYATAHRQRLECRGKLAKAFREFDVLVCPTMGGPAFPVTDDLLYGPIPWELYDEYPWGHFTGPFDFSGQPTLSTPCGITEDGLPLSMQLVARHGQEGLLCRIGHAYEQATGYHRLHPKI